MSPLSLSVHSTLLTHGVASSCFLMTPMLTIQFKLFFRGSCIGGGISAADHWLDFFIYLDTVLIAL